MEVELLRIKNNDTTNVRALNEIIVSGLVG